MAIDKLNLKTGDLVTEECFKIIDDNFAELSLDNNIYVERLWRNEYTSEVYSSPIVTILSSGKVVIAIQGWDWFTRLIDFETGEEIWNRAFSDVCYGSPICGDINGDGKIEFIFSSHSGEIRCYTEDGDLLWEQYDEYTRNGEGTVSVYDNTNMTIVDNSKTFANGLFIRNKNVPTENPYIEITDGTGEGQSVRIKDIENNIIYLAEAFTTPLDATSKYIINPLYESDKIFQHAGTLNEENGKWYLYITGFDFCCRKIDCLTGDIIWIISTKESIEPYPHIMENWKGDNKDKICFVSVDWGIYCADCETGALEWHIETEAGNDAFLNELKLSTGEIVLVVSSRDSRVYLVKNDGNIHNKTTQTNADIDSRPVVGDFNNDGKLEFAYGGDSGWVYCCDENCETLWRHNIGTYINSSSNKADVNYDGNDEILVNDMNGTISILDAMNGRLLHELNCHGAVEGTPTIGDFDNDSNIEMVVTTLNNYLEVYRFKNNN